VGPFTIGLDLGQAQDYSALVVLERALWVSPRTAARLLLAPGWHWPGRLLPAHLLPAWADDEDRRPVPNPPLAVTHIRRWPLGTGYPSIVGDVIALLSAPPLRPEAAVLVVDETGVGRPVVDLLRQAGIPQLCAVTITAGNSVVPDPDPAVWGFRTPKRDLVSSVAVVLEQRRLKIAEGLPEAATLVKELQEFKRRVTPVGNDTYASWREAAHDDLVLALALAVWLREFWDAHTEIARAQLAGAR
jgi:hypothetical protein